MMMVLIFCGREGGCAEAIEPKINPKAKTSIKACSDFAIFEFHLVW
jgi:hypothetical protein